MLVFVNYRRTRASTHTVFPILVPEQVHLRPQEQAADLNQLPKNLEVSTPNFLCIPFPRASVTVRQPQASVKILLKPHRLAHDESLPYLRDSCARENAKAE